MTDSLTDCKNEQSAGGLLLSRKALQKIQDKFNKNMRFYPNIISKKFQPKLRRYSYSRYPKYNTSTATANFRGVLGGYSMRGRREEQCM